MENVVTALSNGLSSATLWGEVGTVIPFVVISVLFGFGFYLVKRVLNKIKKGKGGI